MPYNPFDKPTGNTLNKEDLQRLVEQEVAEGYFVEYKSELPTKAKIAHSIASFANTYGGWYIIGVKTDGNNVAKEICGFSLKESLDPVSKVRDVVKTHLDPVPIFYPQLVTLETNKVVLLVYIPGDQETPFVAKDGRIYRRNHDSSDPVAETSRYTIDRLVDAGRDFTKGFERFCSDGRTFTEAEERQGWVNLYLSPSPLGTVEKSDWFSHAEIDRLLQLSKNPFKLFERESITATGHLPFNVGYPTHRSIVLKQVASENVAFNSLTVELFMNGRAKFFIPMPYDTRAEQGDLDQLESNRVREVLAQTWSANRQEFSKLRFLDFGQLGLVIASLFAFYETWIGKESWFTDLVVGVAIENPSRTIPFFDADEWGDHVQKFGLPVINQKKITVPDDIGRGFSLGWGEEDAMPRWMIVYFFTALAFGFALESYSHAWGFALERAAKKTSAASKGQKLSSTR